MKLSPIRQIAHAAVLVCLSYACTTTLAQTTAPADKPSDVKNPKSAVELERVIVTAQKRLQEAQDVPISLYSVTGQALERTGVKSIEELGNSVAGVTIGALNAGELNISIRGVGDLSEAAENSSANGLYIDEAPLGGFPGTQPDFGLWDVERVEVLRGPQGTLFGEGSMGGTIRIITKKPDASRFFGRVAFGGSQVSGGGSGNRAQGSVNVPLVANQLALIAAYGSQKLPGWIAIPDLGLKNTNEATKTDLRLALRWTPQPNLTVDASFISSESNGGDGGATSPGVLDPAKAFPGAGKIMARNQRTNQSKVSNLTINYDLGPVSLVSSTTAFDQEITRTLDNSFITPLFFGPAGAGGTAYGSFPTHAKAFTEELRLASNGDQALGWTVGAYYRDANQDYLPLGYTITVPGFGLVNDKNLLSEIHNTKAYAFFGEAEYKLAKDWSIQTGLRYYSEDKTLSTFQETSSAIFGTKAGTTTSGSNKASATSPKLVLNWNYSPETLVFAKVSKGFRGGGANTLEANLYPEAPRGFNPETLIAYEAGVKTSPARGWYLNTYVYRNDWNDLQLALLTQDGLSAYTANVGKAESTGAEVELGGRLSPGLNVGLSFAYIDAKIKGTVRNAQGVVVAQDGNIIQLTPKTKVGLTADYSFNFSDALRAQITGRYRESAPTFSTISNSEAERNPASKQLYLRAAVRSGDWEAGIYGDNLLNRDDSNFKRRPITLIPLVFTTYVPPRTVGVDFKYSF